MTTRANLSRVTGPLAEYAPGFAEELRRRGYTEPGADNQLWLLSHLSRWLAARQWQAIDLTPARAKAFLRERRKDGYKALLTARGMAPVQGYLREIGVFEEPAGRKPAGLVDELLERYRRHLVGERGLTASTVDAYERYARSFLSRSGAKSANLQSLTGHEVMQFVLHESERRSVSSAKHLVTALRSLLRFMYLEGAVPALADTVPAVANWRGAALPRALDRSQVDRLLDSCDQGMVTGRRDRAILLLMVRLSLRAGEVAALELSDIDWRQGEILIRGKGRRHERLPLPVDVGEAVSKYLLDGRPRIEYRQLFLRAIAPAGSLTSGSVTTVVVNACKRAGMRRVGAHRLRHTAATEMLRGGASLAEIGQVLRHRKLFTTAIYAKVDRTALRELARPWAGAAS
jgi:integrase/recombinase XerD